MTGRDLIIYIVANGLEDTHIKVDMESLHFLTTEEAAIKFGVGEATIRTWYKLKMIEGFKADDKLYISPKVKPSIRLKKK